MDQRWCLGNKKTNKVEKNLYPNQVAQRVIDHLKEGYTEVDWVVWLPGWPSWKPLNENQELLHEIKLLKKLAEEAPPPMSLPMAPPPPPLEIVQAAEEKVQVNRKIWETRKPETVAPVVETVATSDPNQNYANKRKHKRIFVRFRCIIRSATVTFRTFTKDISLGGVALEDEIPMDLIGTECMIYITSPKANKNLKFKIALTGRSVAKYFSFQDVNADLLSELGQWLEEHEQDSAA